MALKVTIKNCPEFSAFIRACLGVVYVPLQRVTEAIRNLYILAKKMLRAMMTMMMMMAKIIRIRKKTIEVDGHMGAKLAQPTPQTGGNNDF